MRTRTAALLTAAFAAAAVGLSVLVPSDEFQQAPFVQTVPKLGKPVATRTFTVTVDDVKLADRVQTPDWTGTTNGVWLVVDISFATNLQQGGIDGALTIGDTAYRTSARPDTASIDGGGITLPGLPMAGSMLVELPLSALDAPGAHSAVLRFSTTDDPRLDGVVDLVIDLTTLDHESSISLQEPGRVPS